MYSLPLLIEEDIQQFQAALGELLGESEAAAAFVVDKGGSLVTSHGAVDQYDVITLGALAAGAFNASEAIAGLLHESNFTTVYQQGEQFSLLISVIDSQCLLVVLFQAQISVGAVRYYAASAIQTIARQLAKALARAPQEGLDLALLNVDDTTNIFRRKQ
jgi:predicted regulator of Ras-like GTPase activity (Roadblock/LC7/MglB family)